MRETVRRGIATYFGGPLDLTDPAASVYRPGRLLDYGLSTVRAYAGRARTPETDYTAGLDPARGMGARMVVALPTVTERRVSLGGWKALTFQVTLGVTHLGTVPHPELAQDDLDELLEAVVGLVRADPTLGGCVLQAGESQRGIVTTCSEPLIEGDASRTLINASVAFDCDVYLEG